MNRGELPGYYWDEEKKRYFKIQANHLVPNGTKYAKGSVNQEKRLAKKRKVDERNRLKREKHSVKSAPVLSATIGRIGLLREQQGYGYAKPHQAPHQAEAALVTQWRPRTVAIQPEMKGRRLRDAHYVPETQTMLVASSNELATGLYARDWDWDKSHSPASDSVVHVAGLHGGLTSISTRVNDRGCLIVASAEQNPIATVFAGLLPDRSAESGIHCEQGVYFSLGSADRGTACYDTTIHPEYEAAALIGSSGIHLLNIIVMNLYSKLQPVAEDLEWPGCDAGISWLDRNTILYGAKEAHHSVMLWDTRTSSGKTARFTVRERLTGVFTPCQPGNSSRPNNPHEILASTNHRIHLFDVRMPRSSDAGQREAPVLSFPHVHGGPRLQSAANSTLVAAVDRDNMIQVYSIRTGTKVTQLTTPPWQPKKLESPALRKLMWYDDPEAGSVLQAVRGNGVVRWAWEDGEDEESD